MMALYPLARMEFFHLGNGNCSATGIISAGCKCRLMRMSSIMFSLVMAFDSTSASGMLPQCSLHGPDGRRAANELPVLWHYMCHQHRRADYHRSIITAGKGMLISLIHVFRSIWNNAFFASKISSSFGKLCGH